MSIKAILFDMDGVLIDAREWHYLALNRALELFGFEITRYDHLTTFDGLPTRKKLEVLSLQSGLPRGLHPFIQELKQKFTVELIHTSCKPAFQHERALSKLKQDGFRLAVCSNSIRETVHLMLQKANILSYFDFFLSNEDVKRSKPHPEIYQLAMERLGVSPEQSLVLEDNQHGIEAARNSQAHVLVVRNPSDVSYEFISDRITQLSKEINK